MTSVYRYERTPQMTNRTMLNLDRRSLLKYTAASAATAAVAGAPLLRSHSALAQDTPTPAEDQTLHYLWDVDVRSQDPANALESNSFHIVRAAYEGLVAQVTGTTDIKPALATEWTIAEDAQSVTFKLREGVQFHDGTTMDATAVKKSYDRVIAMALGPASLLDSVASVDVVDDLTVDIKLKAPNVYFMAYVPKIGIVSPTAWENNQKDGDYGAAYLEENTAGTGPYRITEITPNTRRVMERFDNYWQGWDGNHLSKIIFEIVPEVETRRQMLVDGEAHLVGSLPADTVKALDGTDGITVNISKNFEIDIATFNMEKAPLDDLRVRQAIQLAFDYEGFRDSVLLGYGNIPNGPFAPDYPGYDPSLPVFAQDLEKAKALIDEAGVAGQTITMNFLDGRAEEEQCALVVQDTLGQIGLNVELKGMPWATMFDVAGNQEVADHMSVLLMSTFTADPCFTLNQNYGIEFAGKPYNWSWYRNQDMQNLVDQAAQTLDEAERTALLQQAAGMIVADAPAIFFSNPQAVEAVNSRVQNYIWNPVDYYWQVAWYDVWLSE